jgi:hypothetical protein
LEFKASALVSRAGERTNTKVLNSNNTGPEPGGTNYFYGLGGALLSRTAAGKKR